MPDIVYKNFHFSTPFLRGYRELKIPIIDSDGHPAWPELFPIERIDALRQTVGARHFSSQMMLDFVPPDRARLDPDGLNLYSDEFDMRTAKIGDVLITGTAVYWDPSSGGRHSDGSVCVLLYRDDASRRVFIHDVLYITVPDGTLHPLGLQCDRVIDFLSRYNLRRIYIETNGIGNALPEIMRDTCTRRGIQIAVQRIINNKNKESRILDAIEPILGTGRLYMHTRVQQTPLISEMIGWTGCDGVGHDDGLDALAGAICAVPTPVRPFGATIQSIKANTNFCV
ncbi:MAG: hypothetical protein NC311_00990 [Muribaculaceae bacterium]|nr:hypothetical protein [Muribaculaceae bacterium]